MVHADNFHLKLELTVTLLACSAICAGILAQWAWPMQQSSERNSKTIVFF